MLVLACNGVVLVLPFFLFPTCVYKNKSPELCSTHGRLNSCCAVRFPPLMVFASDVCLPTNKGEAVLKGAMTRLAVHSCYGDKTLGIRLGSCQELEKS